jgi:dihydropyrimidinase
MVQCDIGISQGKIAAVLAPDESGPAEHVIDARGLIVLPGVIDAHVHFGLGSSDDWVTESKAAARGGVTTVLNYIQHADSYLAAGEAELRRAEYESVIDFGLHFILMNELHLEEIPRYVDDLGVNSFKYFTNFKGDEGAYLGIQGTDTGFFYDLCRRVARDHRLVLAVHTENIEIVWRLAGELRAAGAEGLGAWTQSRPDFVEAHDMFTAFLFAERTGARIYIPHVSSAEGLRVYREHRARGGKSYVETCPHYLTHHADSPLGTLVKVNPPVRTPQDSESLWAGISSGDINVVGSDHNSRRRERKEGSIWTASAGFPGVTTLLPVLLHEGHHRRGIPVERLVEVVTARPAQIFGLYPKKGVIAAGSDADLTVVDLQREVELDSSSFGSHADYSIYDGWRIRGWPVMTVVRGRVVMSDDEILAEPGYGEFIHRPVEVPRPGAADAVSPDLEAVRGRG